MNIIQPSKQFLVEHSINNPADTTTYYAQVIITDSVSGSVLATISLGAGNPYWSKIWVTPPDTSGTGRQLTIQKTIFTDSGYTQVSPIYGSTYESAMLRNIAGGFGQPMSGFTREMTVSEVKKVVLDALKTLPPPPEMPKQDKYDDSNLRGAFQDLTKRVEAALGTHEKSQVAMKAWIFTLLQKLGTDIKKSPPEQKVSIPTPAPQVSSTDYSPHFAALSKKVDAIPWTNLKPLTDRMDKLEAKTHPKSVDPRRETVESLLALRK
jgi:hypothetical protein